MWESAVDLVRMGIIGAGNLCGGSLGSAVLLVSFGVRLALLPFTLRLAREARAKQAKLAALRPAVEALRKRHAADPTKLWQETQALYRANEIRLFAPRSLLGLVIQAPVFAALFSATRRGLGSNVRFLWVAELARPDAILAVAASALTATVAANSMSGAGSGATPAVAAPIIAAVVGVTTLVFLWSASSAVALSMAAGSLSSALQSWLLARDRV